MGVLISAGGALGGPNGGERRCDATCHGARKGTPCVCICGGRYHAGGTFQQVIERHTDDWLNGRSDLPPQPIDRDNPSLFARA